ncbi:MATE family efflux transporter [uncultured Methanobrevibacter sp.]|uniref:MATE family efflux transporter n=1 Tax=uncultured Methanobrevibacter sp. TaxID=253161 RepID=UPI0025D60E23|nr:MATE family efflux transporter [uncultured Methanobrevibacter sp.]
MSNEIINIKFNDLLLPTLLVAMTLNISAVVDSFFVASFIGESAIAAIDILEPVMMLITIIEWLLGLGGQILALNMKGSFDEEGSNKYFTVSVGSTIIMCIILVIIAHFAGDAILNFLHPPADAMPYLKAYAPILFLCFPISTLLGVLSQFIRVDGQPNFASFLMIIATVINAVLNAIFLTQFHMGITGVAIATVIGYALALLFSLKYHFDSKRTFRYVFSKIPVIEWFKSVWRMCKVGFPSASSGLFQVVVIFIINRILTIYMGSVGLVSYVACMDSLLITGIVIIGFIETFASIIPVYYAQNDYGNIKYAYNKAVRASLIFAIIFTIILWINPDLFLMLYNLHTSPHVETFRWSLRIFSLSFVPAVFGNAFIFYYEAIERSLLSVIVSVISMFIGPLVIIFTLLPFIGVNSIWISFTASTVLALVVMVIGIKIIERREKEYSGMLLFKEDLIPHTEYFTLHGKNDETEVMGHLKSLECTAEDYKNIEAIVNCIFDNNDADTIMEIMVIDYDDNVNVNIKDTGKEGLFDEIKINKKSG